MPRLDPRQRPLTVDSPVGPELQEDDLSAQLLKAEWSGSDPGAVGQLRGRAVLQWADERVPEGSRRTQEYETDDWAYQSSMARHRGE